MEVLLCRQPDARVRILVVLVEISCERVCKPGVLFFLLTCKESSVFVLSSSVVVQSNSLCCILPCLCQHCNCTVHEYCLNVANLEQSCHQ